MKFKTLLIILILCLTAGLSLANQFYNSGFLELRPYLYLNDDKYPANDRLIVLKYNIETKPNDKSFFACSLKLKESESSPNQNRIYLEKMYLDIYGDAYDLKLGKNVFNWGKADIYNPTDNLNPYDYTDPLNIADEKLGIESLKLSYYPEDWTVEGIWGLGFTPSVMPEIGSRWGMSLPSQSGGFNIKYDIFGPQKPNVGSDSWQYALRAIRSLAGLDFSLSYYNGRSNLPYYTITKQIEGTIINVTAEAFYPRKQVIGGDVSTVIGEYGVRGEAGYFIYNNQNNVRTNSQGLKYIVGLDRTFRNFINDHELYIITEYAQEISDYSPWVNGFYIPNIDHPFQQAILIKSTYKIRTDMQFAFQDIYNLKDKDYYYQLGMIYEFSNGLKLELNRDVLAGDDNTFFGTYKENGRYVLSLKYNY